MVPAIPPISKSIHVRGCMVVIREELESSVMPVLMAAAIILVVVALLELVLVMAACCFADHVKKIKDFRSE